MDIAKGAPEAAARSFLREACRGVHDRLDARLSRTDFNDREAYADMLSRMSGPVSSLERALSRGVAPALFDNWTAHLRTSSLRRDLSTLGARFVEGDTPAIEQEAEALGTLYVLEGSRLGARVLSRMAAASQDEHVRGATQFFHHGERAGLWRRYLERLETSVAVRKQPERAEKAALAAFAAFETAFT